MNAPSSPIFQWVILFLKGMAMGAADVVPGVSGGTIAFITGIYERLLDAIKGIRFSLLRTLRSQGFLAAWKQADAGFLLVLLSGIALSLLSLARLMVFLLEFHPIPLWAFFFGLVFASVWIVQKQRRSSRPWQFIPLLVGAAFAWWVTNVVPTETPESLWFIFLAGAMAICAMILPGISGSFILLILGKYFYIIQAFKDLNFLVLGTFALGCMAGLLSFVRVVSFLFKKYHDFTVVLLIGFMLGSLPKIWPWRIPSITVETPKGIKVIQELPVLPDAYAFHFQQEPQIGLAAIAFLVALVVVLGLDWVSRKFQKD